jgi:hypothetical protein
VTMATDTTCPRPRRDPKDTVLQGLYILLFVIAGITCLTGILFLRSGLRIAEPASTTGVIISSSAPVAPPAAVSDQRRSVPVLPGVTISQGRAPSGKASRR